MHFTPHIFLIFLALLHVSHSTQLQSPRMLNSNFVTKSGNISINSDAGDYYVNVDLANHYNDASEDENFDNDRVSMILALYASQTMLTSGPCFGFFNYDCIGYQCTLYKSDNSTPVFSDFEVKTGYYAKAQVYLDYTYWQLNSDATLASSCSGSSYSNYGGRYGILGLGRNGTEANFLKSSQMFSVYIDSYYDHSILLFGENTNITTISSLIGSVQTNADWNILPSPVGIDFYNYQDSLTLGAIFDLNAKGIGVPLTLFNTIIQTLESTGSVDCENSTDNPDCYLYRDNNNGQSLPTLRLTIQGQVIDIPPDLYASDDVNEQGNVKFSLYFRALDPSMEGNNYITFAYQNYVVFGSNFLGYYYTEFSYINDNYSVTLYKPNFESPGPVIWPMIVGGVCGFIIVVALILIWIRRRRNNRIKDKAQANKTSSNESYQALVANGSDQNESYKKHDYTTYQYGKESWITPDVPQSS